jgi:hypothetical protein
MPAEVREPDANSFTAATGSEVIVNWMVLEGLKIVDSDLSSPEGLAAGGVVVPARARSRPRTVVATGPWMAQPTPALQRSRSLSVDVGHGR